MGVALSCQAGEGSGSVMSGRGRGGGVSLSYEAGGSGSVIQTLPESKELFCVLQAAPDWLPLLPTLQRLWSSQV